MHHARDKVVQDCAIPSNSVMLLRITVDVLRSLLGGDPYNRFARLVIFGLLNRSMIGPDKPRCGMTALLSLNYIGFLDTTVL